MRRGLVENGEEPPCTPGASSSSGLIEDSHGLQFQHLGRAEAEFLYQEIFVRRAYFQSGVSLPATGQPTVVDVGANIGLFSLACHRANPRCRLVAVEPAPAAFAVLERNLSHVGGATCVRQALAESAAARGELTVYPDATAESSRHPRERAMQRARLQAHVASRGGGDAGGRGGGGDDDGDDDVGGGGGGGGGGGVGGGAGVQCACAVGTLSGLIAQLHLESIDLLKIDCEGDELRVLHGLCSADWRRVRQVAMEVHDIYGRLDAAVALLRRHGFRVTCAAQRGGTERGYVMVVPAALRLFHVYAVRAAPPSRGRPPRRCTRAAPPRRPARAR